MILRSLCSQLTVGFIARIAAVLPLKQFPFPCRSVDDDDVELHVLGCRVDILGTNCDQCLSMVQCCFTETARLIRAESPGRPPRLSHSS